MCKETVLRIRGHWTLQVDTALEVCQSDAEPPLAEVTAGQRSGDLGLAVSLVDHYYNVSRSRFPD